ncbi:DNA-binding protein snt1 [Saitoella coloradoensis]
MERVQESAKVLADREKRFGTGSAASSVSGKNTSAGNQTQPVKEEKDVKRPAPAQPTETTSRSKVVAATDAAVRPPSAGSVKALSTIPEATTNRDRRQEDSERKPAPRPTNASIESSTHKPEVIKKEPQSVQISREQTRTPLSATTPRPSTALTGSEAMNAPISSGNVSRVSTPRQPEGQPSKLPPVAAVSQPPVRPAAPRSTHTNTVASTVTIPAGRQTPSGSTIRPQQGGQLPSGPSVSHGPGHGPPPRTGSVSSATSAVATPPPPPPSTADDPAPPPTKPRQQPSTVMPGGPPQRQGSTGPMVGVMGVSRPGVPILRAPPPKPGMIASATSVRPGISSIPAPTPLRAPPGPLRREGSAIPTGPRGMISVGRLLPLQSVTGPARIGPQGRYAGGPQQGLWKGPPAPPSRQSVPPAGSVARTGPPSAPAPQRSSSITSANGPASLSSDKGFPSPSRHRPSGLVGVVPDPSSLSSRRGSADFRTGAGSLPAKSSAVGTSQPAAKSSQGDKESLSRRQSTEDMQRRASEGAKAVREAFARMSPKQERKSMDGSANKDSRGEKVPERGDMEGSHLVADAEKSGSFDKKGAKRLEIEGKIERLARVEQDNRNVQSRDDSTAKGPPLTTAKWTESAPVNKPQDTVPEVDAVTAHIADVKQPNTVKYVNSDVPKSLDDLVAANETIGAPNAPSESVVPVQNSGSAVATSKAGQADVEMFEEPAVDDAPMKSINEEGVRAAEKEMHSLEQELGFVKGRKRAAEENMDKLRFEQAEQKASLQSDGSIAGEPVFASKAEKEEAIVYAVYKQNEIEKDASRDLVSAELYLSDKAAEITTQVIQDAVVAADQLRPAMLRALGKRKAVVREKELALKRQYKRLHDQWTTYTAELDSMKENEERQKQRFVAQAAAAPVVQDTTASYGTSTRASRRNPGGTAGFHHGDAARSEAEFLEILANLEWENQRDPNARAKLTTASIPSMILDEKERKELAYYDDNHRVRVDPVKFYHISNHPDVWTDEEHALFCQRYVQFPKQFGKIAEGIPEKTAQQCVLHYYLTKKSVDYRSLNSVKGSKKRKGGRSKTKKSKTGKTKGSALMADLGRNEEDDEEDDNTAPQAPEEDASTAVQENLSKPKRKSESQRLLEDATSATGADPIATALGTRRKRGNDDTSNSEPPESVSAVVTPNVKAPVTKKARLGRVASARKVPKVEKDKGRPSSAEDESVGTPAAFPEIDSKEADVANVLAGMLGAGSVPVTPSMDMCGFPAPNLVASRSPQVQGVPQTGPMAEDDRPLSPTMQEYYDADGSARKGSRRGTTSSYWSVQEMSDFNALLVRYGKDWYAIADALGTKTATQVKNHYLKNADRFDTLVAMNPLSKGSANVPDTVDNSEASPPDEPDKRHAQTVILLPKQTEGRTLATAEAPGLDKSGYARQPTTSEILQAAANRSQATFPSSTASSYQGYDRGVRQMGYTRPSSGSAYPFNPLPPISNSYPQSPEQSVRSLPGIGRLLNDEPVGGPRVATWYPQPDAAMQSQPPSRVHSPPVPRSQMSDKPMLPSITALPPITSSLGDYPPQRSSLSTLLNSPAPSAPDMRPVAHGYGGYYGEARGYPSYHSSAMAPQLPPLSSHQPTSLAPILPPISSLRGGPPPGAATSGMRYDPRTGGELPPFFRRD